MKIEGQYQFSAARELVFAALMDPAVLRRALPGCEKLDKNGENNYAATLRVGIGPVKGTFSGSVRLENIEPPSRFRMVLDGKGQPGFVKGAGELQLSEQDGGTLLAYSADIQIGGLLATVGQRMVQSTVRMMAGKFFEALAGEIEPHCGRDPERSEGGSPQSLP